MSVPSTSTVMVAAVLGNLAVAAIKFVAAWVTGSSAMLSEGIHSLVDTGNGLVLLWGLHRSRRPPDERHPFGHGLELYFWSVIVAIQIFAFGGGMSIYEGIVQIRAPIAQRDPMWNYLVLAFAFLFDGITWTIAWRQFASVKGSATIWQAVRNSKDPTSFMILFEDSAALLGVAIAAMGVFLNEALGEPRLDGVAAILIGVVLMVVAWVLVRESRSLLLGESADSEIVDSVLAIAKAESAIEHVQRPLTMHFGPDQVLLNLDVQFRPGLSSEQIEAAVDRVEAAIRREHPNIKRIFVEAEAIVARKDRLGGVRQPSEPAGNPKLV